MSNVYYVSLELSEEMHNSQVKPRPQGCLQAGGTYLRQEGMGMWDICEVMVGDESVPRTSLERVPLVDARIQIQCFCLLMD